MTKSTKSYSATSVPRLRAEVDKQASPAYVWSMLSPSTCPFSEKGPTWMEMYNAKFPTRARRQDYTCEMADLDETVADRNRSVDNASRVPTVKESRNNVENMVSKNLVPGKITEAPAEDDLPKVPKHHVQKVISQALAKSLVEDANRRSQALVVVEETVSKSSASNLVEGAVMKVCIKVRKEEEQKKSEFKLENCQDEGLSHQYTDVLQKVDGCSENELQMTLKRDNCPEQNKSQEEEHAINTKSDKTDEEFFLSETSSPGIFKTSIPETISGDSECYQSQVSSRNLNHSDNTPSSNMVSETKSERASHEQTQPLAETTQHGTSPSTSWMERLSKAKPWQKYLIAGGIAVTVIGVSVILAKKFKS